MGSLFKHPKKLPLIAPSILSADFCRMGDEIKSVLAAGADLLHVDIMDGHFVPNLTMGPALLQSVRRAFPDVFLDVHLMVNDPERFIEPFAEAGANHLTFHVEVIPPDRIELVAEKIRQRGLTAGLAINPPTPIDQLLPHVDKVDLVLVMSVNPGFSGQRFIAEVLAKTRAVAEVIQPDQRLEMDGGIKPDNSQEVIYAGCDVLVSASAIFGVADKDRPSTIAALRGRVA